MTESGDSAAVGVGAGRGVGRGAGPVAAVGLPAGLAELEPGPQLVMALASVDRSTLDEASLVVLVQARSRLLAFVQAQLLADLRELAHTPVGSSDEVVLREGRRVEFAKEAVGWALTATPGYASYQLDLADAMLVRLPQVGQALAGGRICLGRARVFHELLDPIDDDQLARSIAVSLLDKATGWTVSQLRANLRRQIIKTDPDTARTRYIKALPHRRTWFGLHPDSGTAALGGVDLPVPAAASAADRIDRTARAARADGDPRNLQQLRADIFLALLNGDTFQTRPPTDQLTQTTVNESGLNETSTAEPGASETGAPDSDDPLSIDNPPSIDDPIGDAVFEWSNDATVDLAQQEQLLRSLITLTPTDLSTIADLSARPCTCNKPPDRKPPKGKPETGPPRGRVDIEVSLQTLAGLAEDPAELPGWGPIIADIARQIAFDPNNPAWRLAITDQHGKLLHLATTRRRPTTSQDQHVRARDKTCQAPGCTRKANQCDLDHRHEHANGGPTHPSNLITLCRRHHRMRHSVGLTAQPTPDNTIIWQKPNHQRIQTTHDRQTLHIGRPGIDRPTDRPPKPGPR